MTIYGLVGTSGTGKSYRALGLANERGIPCIIDDGLLIRGTKVLAGVSAKKEPTKISAIRRALFMDTTHTATVMEAIRLTEPESILILGTSVSMIYRIAHQLKLPPVTELIKIEDISTEREIRLALRQRKEQGKHVIPVPTFEISKDFSGYFIDPLKIFRIWGKEKKMETLEKTVVRPTFSYMGSFFIADSAIEAIVTFNAQGLEGIHKVQKCQIVSRPDGVVIYVDVTVFYGYKIHTLLEEVQQKVKSDVGRVTGLNVLFIHVAAKRLIVQASGIEDA